MPFVALLTVVSLAGSSQMLTDPLAPAAKGQLQCYHPDEQKKTCRAIGSYTRLPNSSYDNIAEAVISANGPVTLEMRTSVEVRQGAVCGTITTADVTAGSLRIGGRVLGDREAAPILSRIAQGMRSILNQEICTRYEANADGSLTAKASVAGVERPEVDERVKWVDPQDAYRVSP